MVYSLLSRNTSRPSSAAMAGSSIQAVSHCMLGTSLCVRMAMVGLLGQGPKLELDEGWQPLQEAQAASIGGPGNWQPLLEALALQTARTAYRMTNDEPLVPDR